MNIAKTKFALAVGIMGALSTVSAHAFTLDYLATVPLGHPSGFGGVKYALHLEGVTAVPEASTYATMLAGLVLVGFAARRRSQPGSMVS